MVKIRLSLYSEQREALEKLLRETERSDSSKPEYARGFDITVAAVCISTDQEG